jgi:hypothetical protein
MVLEETIRGGGEAGGREQLGLHSLRPAVIRRSTFQPIGDVEDVGRQSERTSWNASGRAELGVGSRRVRSAIEASAFARQLARARGADLGTDPSPLHHRASERRLPIERHFQIDR